MDLKSIVNNTAVQVIALVAVAFLVYNYWKSNKKTTAAAPAATPGTTTTGA